MTRSPLDSRPLGATGLAVSGLCVGTSPLASIESLYGYNVDERSAVETVLAVLDSPITFMDTSNAYGSDGAAERRIGIAIKEHGGLPSGFVLATKVDPDQVTREFSGARAFASYEESLDRLGLDSVPLLYVHDPETIGYDAAMADDGPVAALVRLRDEGRVHRIGVAAGNVELVTALLATDLFDVVLNHNRYTLLDRSAQALFVDAHGRGIGTVNAAPYGGGMLSKGPSARAKYCYGDADSRVIEAAEKMEAACERHGVPLPAAALQFSLRASFVDSTAVGMSSPARVAQTLEYAQVEISDELWNELEALAPPSEAWLP